MQRENYYLLLELSVDPPENDLQIIEDAIKEKQTRWSRNRNHPTKAIQSKQYIGLIPEIRRIMTDSGLRQKEAENAKILIFEKEKEKFLKIERHLSILMTKGSVTKKEIAKLARMHGTEEAKIHERLKKKEKFFKIDRDIRLLMKKGAINEKKTAGLAKRYAIGEDKLRKWIKEKEEEANSELDNCIRICTEKGYITEKETTHLASLFAMDEANILLRAKCPIKKESASKPPKPQPLDKTLEKLISDNLNIVGKSSLYDFLDLSPDANLQILQDRAKEKRWKFVKSDKKTQSSPQAVPWPVIVLLSFIQKQVGKHMTSAGVTPLFQNSTPILTRQEQREKFGLKILTYLLNQPSKLAWTWMRHMSISENTAAMRNGLSRRKRNGSS